MINRITGAEVRFAAHHMEKNDIDKPGFQADSKLYLPVPAQFGYLLLLRLISGELDVPTLLIQEDGAA